MSLRIHICQDNDDANRLIKTEKRVLGKTDVTARILAEPEIVIFDYSSDSNNPILINENKVCVIFED